MRQIYFLILSFLIINLNAEETVGIPFAPKLNVRQNATIKAEKIGKLNYLQEVEVLAIQYDKEGRPWYKTTLGYVYGPSVTIDIRKSLADFLHIRLKPSLRGKIVSYHLKGAKVIVIRKAGFKDGYHWVLTTDGYVASDYLTPSVVHNIKVIKLKHNNIIDE